MGLTDDDLKSIRELLREEIREEVPQIVEEKVGYLPTKDEFYTKMDEVMGELKAIREEVTVFSKYSKDHEDRIKDLEVLHPEGGHATT